MPADTEDDVLHRLLDDHSFTFRQRWVLNQGKLNERILFASLPIAESLRREAIAGHDDVVTDRRDLEQPGSEGKWQPDAAM